jgi:hypothetical protein
VTQSRIRPMLAVALGASILLAACGLPTDNTPRVIAADKVPYSLLGPSTTNQGIEAGGVEVQLYFVDDQRLRPVKRRVPDTSPVMVLEALIRGPADRDPRSLKGAIPPETRVLRADLETDATLTVVLTKDILSVTGPLQKNAFAQLVYTATDLPGVSRVRFKVAEAAGDNEQDVDPPTEGGATKAPLSKGDYSSLAPIN